MNVLQNLTELYNHLSFESTYRNVLRSILEQLPELRGATTYELAERTNASRTTIARMVQKLGYANVSDFQHALNAAISQYGYYNRILRANHSTFPHANHSTGEGNILQESVRLLHKAGDLLQNNMSADHLSALAADLHRAKRVHFYLPFQISAVLSLQQNLAMTGRQTDYVRLLPEMLAAAEYLDENSVLIAGALEFAETLSMRPVFERAQKQGAIIWLAGSPGSQYAKYADEILIGGSTEDYSYVMALEAFLIALSESYRMRYIETTARQDL